MTGTCTLALPLVSAVCMVEGGGEEGNVYGTLGQIVVKLFKCIQRLQHLSFTNTIIIVMGGVMSVLQQHYSVLKEILTITFSVGDF